MMLRHVVTWVLLIFVAATLGRLALDELGPAPRTEEAGAAEVAGEEGNALIAYFIHTDVRCWNCNTIERLAHETLTERFPEELAAGAIEWRVVNMDEPGNEHYGDDFELLTSSVVLVETEGGERKSWKNLSRVWDLVHEEEEFKAYVEEAVRARLEAGT